MASFSYQTSYCSRLCNSAVLMVEIAHSACIGPTIVLKLTEQVPPGLLLYSSESKTFVLDVMKPDGKCDRDSKAS